MAEKKSPAPDKTVSSVYTSELLRCRWISKKAFEIELTKSPQFEFSPGQCKRTPVFVATGTGIAPFLSMGRSGVAGFNLLHEVETPEELYDASSFRSFAKRSLLLIRSVGKNRF